MKDSDKIKKIRHVLKMNQEDFADSIGYGQGIISHIEQNRRPITSQMARKIAAMHDINLEWILLDKGTMSLSELQEDNSSDYIPSRRESSLSRPEKQQGAKGNARQLAPRHEKQNLIIVPLKAFGGFLMGYKNKVYLNELNHALYPWIQGECYAFQVEGFSMYKSKKIGSDVYEIGYKPDSYVICTVIEGFKDLMKNRDYVFQTIDGLILKRFVEIKGEKCCMESLNEEYNPVEALGLKSIKRIYFVERKDEKPFT